MAFILSLFSDAEMSGRADVSLASASVNVRPAVSAVPNESAPRAEAVAPSGSVLSEPAPPQVVEVAHRLGSDWGYLLNPCVQCRYRDLCDDDYCGMLRHPIDMDNKPTRRGWLNYGIY